MEEVPGESLSHGVLKHAAKGRGHKGTPVSWGAGDGAWRDLGVGAGVLGDEVCRGRGSQSTMGLTQATLGSSGDRLLCV